jgi:hypothetical protein
VGLGRTDTHVTLVAGPWTLALLIEKSKHFPETRSVIPSKTKLPTTLRLADEDVAFLVCALPEPPNKEDFAPSTLDLGSDAVVRTTGQDGAIVEIILARSSVVGPAVRLGTNPRYLLRALALGFREFHIGQPAHPVLSHDGLRSFMWMPLDQGILAPSSNALRLVSTQGASTSPGGWRTKRTTPLTPPAPPPPPAPPTPPMPPTPMATTPKPGPEEMSLAVPLSTAITTHIAERRKAVTESPNGAAPTREGVASPGMEELITEVEALRGTLQDAQVRLGRLAAALKQQRRQARAVQAAMASLRQLPEFGG